MNIEWSLGGVLFPPLLVSVGAALVVTGVVRRVLSVTGAYRFVWHPALFDLALFVLVLGGLDAVIS